MDYIILTLLRETNLNEEEIAEAFREPVAKVRRLASKHGLRRNK